MKAATLKMRRWRKKNRERQRENDRRWRKNNLEKARAKNRHWYKKNRKYKLEQNAKYHRDNRKQIAKRHRLVAFKMTSEQHDAKLKEQKGRCAVCKKLFSVTPRIDHSHKCCPKRPTCGKCNRGLLCNYCNVLIGMCFESEKVLTNAIQYLKEYKNGHQA